jgi:hypothetical protein
MQYIRLPGLRVAHAASSSSPSSSSSPPACTVHGACRRRSDGVRSVLYPVCRRLEERPWCMHATVICAGERDRPARRGARVGAARGGARDPGGEPQGDARHGDVHAAQQLAAWPTAVVTSLGRAARQRIGGSSEGAQSKSGRFTSATSKSQLGSTIRRASA